MPQIVSKNLQEAGEIQRAKLMASRSMIRDDVQLEFAWRQPLMIAFHGTAASIYGFAICWQNVSEAAHALYLRSNPYVRVYGRWRFLTYNCLIMQFVAFSLCLTTHFVPKLRKPRDFFFTTFAFPVGMLVVSCFWAIWFIAGREYIFPAALEPFYPPWLNHITHTIIAPINLAELLLNKKQYSTDKRSMTALAAYTISYTSYLLYIRWQTGRFVYPFLNQMSAVPVGAFIVGMVAYGICVYKSGKLLHDLVHGARMLKGKLTASSKVKKQH